MTRFVLTEFAIWMAVAEDAALIGLWQRYYHVLAMCAGLLHGG
jgi:hypothetical protein